MLREEAGQLRAQLERLSSRIKRLHSHLDGETEEESAFRQTLEQMMRDQREIDAEMRSAEPPAVISARRAAPRPASQVANGRRAGKPLFSERRSHSFAGECSQKNEQVEHPAKSLSSP